jgi:hypothetical protein
MVEYRCIAKYPTRMFGSDGSVWRQVDDGWEICRTLPNGRMGYLRVGVRLPCGERKTRYIHRLILETFGGPCPPGMEACHNDGNPLNNSASNLRWDTPGSNQADRRTHGTSGTGTTKLTEDQVREIRAEYSRGKKGCGYLVLSRKYSVRFGTIKAVVMGKTWKHVA